MIANVGETKTLKLSNKLIKSFLFKVYLTGETDNLALVPADFLPENVYVRLTLKRGGKQKVLFQDSLRVLSAGSCFTNAAALLSFRASSGYSTLTASGAWKLQAATSGTVEIDVAPFLINLKGVIDLCGSDRLELQINPASNCISANVNGSSGSTYIDFTEEVADHAYEFGTPVFETYAVQAGQGRFEIDLGPNVRRVIWLNFDQANQSLAEQIINNVTLNSDVDMKGSTYIDLLNRQIDYYPTPSVAVQRGQSLIIYDGKGANRVSLDFQLIAANVNASMNYLYVERDDIDASVAAHASVKQTAENLTAAVASGVVSGSTPAVASALSSAVGQQAAARKAINGGKAVNLSVLNASMVGGKALSLPSLGSAA